MSSEYSRDMAVIDWLEEVPIDELPENCQPFVIEFREGMIDVQEAISILEHEFSDEMDRYVQQNLEIRKLMQ